VTSSTIRARCVTDGRLGIGREAGCTVAQRTSGARTGLRVPLRANRYGGWTGAAV
jgi:hypothetical protein